MASNKVLLKIMTPKGIFWNQPVLIVRVNTTEGEMGLLPQKSPVIAALKIGILYINYEKDPDHHICAIAGGIVYARGNQIDIITDAIEYQEQIDLKRAEQAKLRAENKLKAQMDAQEELKAKLTLERAINRINAKKGLL